MTATMPGPDLPAHVLNSVLGTLLIGTWVNAMVFALEATQLFRYWILFPKDRLWLKAMVVGMFAVDLTGTASICALCYKVNLSLLVAREFLCLTRHLLKYLVTGWGDVIAMAHQNL